MTEKVGPFHPNVLIQTPTLKLLGAAMIAQTHNHQENSCFAKLKKKILILLTSRYSGRSRSPQTKIEWESRARLELACDEISELPRDPEVHVGHIIISKSGCIFREILAARQVV